MSDDNNVIPNGDAGVTAAPEMSTSDIINAHLNPESQPEAQPTEAPAQESAESEPVQEPQGRAEDRINELNQKFYDAQRQKEQLELMIASNPVMRSEYERLINGGATSDQAINQMAGGQPQQPAPVELPEYDPFDADVVRAYARAEFMKELQPLQQQIAQYEQFIQQQQEERIQQQFQQAGEYIDGILYEAVPQAKEDEIAQGLVTFYFQNAVKQLHPSQRNDLNALAEAARQAGAIAKQKITERFGQAQPVQAAPAKLPYSESATNMVQPRPAQPDSLHGMINAHLSRS